MRRPGPLQDLPIDHILFLNPDINTTPIQSPFRSNKRPLSPGTPAIYSPAKRRLLNGEGIFTPARLKSPLSSSAIGRPSVYFHELLQGPDSPVKRLDFCGGSDGYATSHESTFRPTPERSTRAPVTQSPRSNLPPKSKLVTSATISSMQETIHDCFSLQRGAITHLSSSTSVPTMIPRKLMASDPQSLHYPGFDVFLDTHDYLPTARALATAAYTDKGTRADKPVKPKEVDKENVAPSDRLPCSTPTSPDSRHASRRTGSDVFSDTQRRYISRSGSPFPSALTPRSRRIYEMTGEVGPFPISKSQSLAMDSEDSVLVPLTPSHSIVGELERRRRKMALQDEVDYADAEEF